MSAQSPQADYPPVSPGVNSEKTGQPAAQRLGSRRLPVRRKETRHRLRPNAMPLSQGLRTYDGTTTNRLRLQLG